MAIKPPRNGPKKGKIFEPQLGTFPACGGRKNKRKMLGHGAPSFSAYFFCQGAGLKIKRLYGPFRARLRIPKNFQRLRRQGLPEDLLYKGQATQNRKFPTPNCNLPNRQTHRLCGPAGAACAAPAWLRAGGLGLRIEIHDQIILFPDLPPRLSLKLPLEVPSLFNI